MNDPTNSITKQAWTFCMLIALWLGGVEARAQISSEDYARAERMLGWNASKLVFDTPVSPKWLQGDRFWYRKQVPQGYEFIYVDPSSDVRRPAFDLCRHACPPDYFLRHYR